MTTPFISDSEILARLATEEDSFVERKSFGDWKKDAVKTCVAFANSCPVDGPPGILCIGVKDNGTIENTRDNLDTTQETFGEVLKVAYPPIPYHSRIITTENGKFIAVIVAGSAEGPHFSGPAYARLGPTTVVANWEQFERIIDRRQRVVREILKWKGKGIKLATLWAQPTNASGRIAGYSNVTVIDCDAFTVTLKPDGSNQFIYRSLESAILNRDPESHCLIIETPQP